MDKESISEAEDAYEDHTHFQILCIPITSQRFRSRYKKVQAQCYNFLERPSGVLSVSYHFAVFALVVAGLVLAVLETMEDYQDNEDLQFRIYILELFLLVLFGLEYMLRMWSAGCRSTYVGFLGRFRFSCKPFVIVDLVVIGSTAAVILKNTLSPRAKLSSAISILRFFQVLRMIRFDRQGGSWKLLGSVLFLHKQELLTTIYIGFCSLIFASFFIYQAEKDVNAKEFGTFADSFWWGVVTLTTVGYGDKIPISWAGRGVASFFAIMGISFFALPAGILGSGFALKVSQQQRQKHVKRRRRPAATLIQCNWRYYASRKHSRSVATWLPYIRFIQERNTKRDEFREIPAERPPQNSIRTRKLSIFSRKPSDGPLVNLGVMDHSKVRRKKSSDMFRSFESLQDGQPYPMLDQRHDCAGIVLVDNRGKPSLPPAYKRGIRFTRYLKFLVALRKFKLAKKPYDVKDVIEQYSTGHVELLGKVKGINCKIDDALGYKTGTDKNDESPSNKRTNIVYRLSKLEKQVKNLDSKLDQVISLMEDSRTTNDSAVTSRTDMAEEGVLSCCVCGHNAIRNKKDVLTASQVVDELKMPTRRRKVPMVLGGADTARELQPNSLPKTVSLLTAERLKQVMDENKSRRKLSRSVSLKPEILKRVMGKGKSQHQKELRTDAMNDNSLSPLPYERYDLTARRRSDSAIYSNCSGDKKDDDSALVTPTSSDSEDTSSLPMNNNVQGGELSTLPSPIVSDVHETIM